MSATVDIERILAKPAITREEANEEIRLARAKLSPDREKPEKFDNEKLNEFNDALEKLQPRIRALPRKPQDAGAAPPGGADLGAEALKVANQALEIAREALETARHAHQAKKRQ